MGIQEGWQWCNKCQVLSFAGGASLGSCPSGGQHDHTGSGNYTLRDNDPTAPGQPDWKWCNKCQSLAFAGGTDIGSCPSGGQHDHTGSGNYTLRDNDPTAPGQPDWKWCNKCQSLAFAGGTDIGSCPSGGQHDHTGSGNYTVAFQDEPSTTSHVHIEVHRVHCGNTEDATGADQLYIVGALSDGTTSRGALTSPMKINDNQEKEFNPSERVIFDADVKPDAVVRGGLKAFDEDFGKDWAKYGDTVNKISDLVSQGLKLTKNPKAVVAGEILSYGTKAFGSFASLDKDDELGTIELNVPAQGSSVEEIGWKFKKKGSVGVSTWNYTVIIRVTRS